MMNGDGAFNHSRRKQGQGGRLSTPPAGLLDLVEWMDLALVCARAGGGKGNGNKEQREKGGNKKGGGMLTLVILIEL